MNGLRKLVHLQLKRQYERAMREAYAHARRLAVECKPTVVLDCGAGSGHELLTTFGPLSGEPGFVYKGLEWSAPDAHRGRLAGLDVIEADLNRPLPVADSSIDCIIAFSVLEHLLMPCGFLAECHRVLRPGGRLVILTPNISTWFTALQVISGQMPSSGPHPDSNWLLATGKAPAVSDVVRDNVSTDTPKHRHLVVFSLKTLTRYLQGSGYRVSSARGFGYYPFPQSIQPALERLDPTHCHQMVLACEKST